MTYTNRSITLRLPLKIWYLHETFTYFLTLLRDVSKRPKDYFIVASKIPKVALIKRLVECWH